ncbi:TPA: YvrJ family protein [Clostridium botulinum]|uniref:YvrJ family protein n=2 Tax=Clostridium botulinum TaxID=1491 RepID=A0ABC8CW34_CLOBO|nr:MULTISPECIES: YvrJ family protein [Clostridium]AUM95511.1 YvrJ family protein [Clostridium sporogenes]AVQ38487.1 YvrJ family protein [Clostridium botulinum]AVQ45455.1 YvrJ family protein [Clostridium botulinum]AVQ49289.1 YvrJ family protein [Clostridium botulinum]AVQ52953.1 YvrJ family protein [Clostridium botulinum]
MYEQLIKIISDVGFPIAVSLYLLLRIEKKLDEITKALATLDKTITSVMKQQKDEESTKK